ncbi:hypothetical protein [Asticcacaulis excentricus]|uniref:hypothetical protein n=1 Tax=Asticcacaulis excentricus TaxID=78587 RepID=UPI000F83240C|nr:hypothetical protein [Asticcacaulis excentricus]
MINKKHWFLKVGPFGGLFPVTLLGFVYTVFYVLVVLSLVLKAEDLSNAGQGSAATPWWAAAILVGLVGYVFASAKSK